MLKRISQIFRRIFLLAIVAATFFGLGFLPEMYIVDRGSGIQFLDKEPELLQLAPQAYVSGAVKSPGVYPITPNMRLGELIQVAGGLADGADLEWLNSKLNLAKLATDGEHVYVPFTQRAQPPTFTCGAGLVDLNNSTVQQLDSLPGVGEATAEKIIEARPFASIQELLEVSGIGEEKYADLKSLVCV